MRHFAKLFDFLPLGQLLVQRVNSDEPQDEEQPYKVVAKTCGTVVLVLTVARYKEENERDSHFENFDETAAADLFNSQQNFLTSMGEPA